MAQLSHRKQQLAAFNVKIEELGIQSQFEGLAESYGDGPHLSARGLE